MMIYWVWQPQAGLQRIHTYIQRKLGLYIKYIYTVKSASAESSIVNTAWNSLFLNRFVRARTVGYIIVDRNRDTSLASRLIGNK